MKKEKKMKKLIKSKKSLYPKFNDYRCFNCGINMKDTGSIRELITEGNKPYYVYLHEKCFKEFEKLRNEKKVN